MSRWKLTLRLFRSWLVGFLTLLVLTFCFSRPLPCFAHSLKIPLEQGISSSSTWALPCFSTLLFFSMLLWVNLQDTVLYSHHLLGLACPFLPPHLCSSDHSPPSSITRVCVCVSVCVCVLCSELSNFLWLHGLRSARLLCPWDSPGKNTVVDYHSLLQGIFLTQGSDPCPLHCRQILYHLSHQGSPPSPLKVKVLIA